MKGKGRAEKSLGTDMGSADGAVFSRTEEKGAGKSAQIVVIPIGQNRSAGAHMPQHFGFSPEDPFPGTEKLHMRFPYVGEQADGGLHHGAQGVDLPEVIGTHFNNGAFRLRTEPEKHLRHARLIVEIPGCGVDPVCFGQYIPHHSFGGGLSGAAGDADNGNIKAFPVTGSQLLKRFYTIFHPNGGVWSIRFGERAYGALFHGLRDEPVTVEYFTPHGDIQSPRSQGARIDGKIVYNAFRIGIDQPAAGYGCSFGKSKQAH